MSKKLLLVEPSATMRKAVSLCLAQTGIDVVEVKTAAEAVGKASEEHPDVIAIDTVAEDGYDLCEQFKTTPGLDGIPVLLMGGVSKPVDQQKASQCGSDASIQKPFESQILLEKLCELVGLPAPEPLPGVIVRRPSAAAPAAAPAPAAAAPSRPPAAPVSGAPRPPMAPMSAAPRAAGDAPMAAPPRAPMTGAPRPAPAPVAGGRPPMPGQPGMRPPMPGQPGMRPPMPGQPGMRPPMPGQPGMRPPMPGQPGMRPPMPGQPGMRPPMPGRPPMPMDPRAQEQMLRAMMQNISREIVEKVVWEVVPQLAEAMIREKLDQLDLASLVQKNSGR